MTSALETAFDAACQALKNAQRAYDRSRSRKNLLALTAAMLAFDAAKDAWMRVDPSRRHQHRRAA